MEKSESKTNYVYVAIAALVLLAVLFWAYLNGRRDGSEHNVNRTNKTANAMQ